jgi:hypothetical protein
MLRRLLTLRKHHGVVVLFAFGRSGWCPRWAASWLLGARHVAVHRGELLRTERKRFHPT